MVKNKLLARYKIINRQVVFFLLLISFLASCAEDRVYEKNVDLPKKGWYEDSILVFQFKIEDPAKSYDIYYNIRNTISYSNYNLYVTYYLQDSRGKELASELQNITLFHSKTGQPFGSGLGDIYAHQLKALKKVKFPLKGWYTFRLKQYMRINPVPEIISIGIKVMEAE